MAVFSILLQELNSLTWGMSRVSDRWIYLILGFICVFKIYVTGAVNTSFFCNTEFKHLNFNTNLLIFMFFFHVF